VKSLKLCIRRQSEYIAVNRIAFEKTAFLCTREFDLVSGIVHLMRSKKLHTN